MNSPTPETEHVTTQTVGAVRVISMDDGKANAVSAKMIDDLRSALNAAEEDEQIRAAVIAGRDGRFSGGFDLSVMQSGDFTALVGLVADGGALVRHLYGSSVPVVAACTGHAVAAGALMLMGCDMRIGADAPVKIGFNEVAIGMTLPRWAHAIAKERLGTQYFQRSIANAKLVDGQGGVAVGFLDRAVAPEAVLESAIAEAQVLAETLDPGAYRQTVTTFRGPVLEQMDDFIEKDRQAVS